MRYILSKKIKKFKKKNTGFTLVETIVYTALAGIVLTSFITFSLLVISLKNKNYAIEEVNVSSRAAINEISKKIKRAESVISPTNGQASSTLIIETPEGDLITINSLDGIINLKENNNSAIPITSNQVTVSSINFINLSNSGEKDSIKINLNLEFKNSTSLDFTYEQELQTAVTLRL